MANYKLNPLVAGLALGLFMGVTIVFMAIFGNFRAQYELVVERMSGFYIGYSISALGMLFGFLWAVIDGFCSAFLLVWLYNIIDLLFHRK